MQTTEGIEGSLRSSAGGAEADNFDLVVAEMGSVRSLPPDEKEILMNAFRTKFPRQKKEVNAQIVKVLTDISPEDRQVIIDNSESWFSGGTSAFFGYAPSPSAIFSTMLASRPDRRADFFRIPYLERIDKNVLYLKPIFEHSSDCQWSQGEKTYTLLEAFFSGFSTADLATSLWTLCMESEEPYAVAQHVLSLLPKNLKEWTDIHLNIDESISPSSCTNMWKMSSLVMSVAAARTIERMNFVVSQALQRFPADDVFTERQSYLGTIAWFLADYFIDDHTARGIEMLLGTGHYENAATSYGAADHRLKSFMTKSYSFKRMLSGAEKDSLVFPAAESVYMSDVSDDRTARSVEFVMNLMPEDDSWRNRLALFPDVVNIFPRKDSFHRYFLDCLDRIMRGWDAQTRAQRTADVLERAHDYGAVASQEEIEAMVQNSVVGLLP